MSRVEREPENFKVRTLLVRRMRVYSTDFHDLLTPRPNQTCWVCRRTKLVAGKNTYEIVIGIDRGARVGSGGSNIIERKKVLVCDYCLESISELQDAEIVSFGDGRALPDHFTDNAIGSTPEPECKLSDIIAQHFRD